MVVQPESTHPFNEVYCWLSSGCIGKAISRCFVTLSRIVMLHIVPIGRFLVRISCRHSEVLASRVFGERWKLG